jgi:hypothetical protein
MRGMTPKAGMRQLFLPVLRKTMRPEPSGRVFLPQNASRNALNVPRKTFFSKKT